MPFLPHFLYAIYVWLNYPLVRNIHKVCATGRYAPNKQSTNKHKITMWLTKLKYWSKRTVQNITTRIDKGKPSWSIRGHPLFYLCSRLLIFTFLCILLLLIFVRLFCLFRFAIVLLIFQLQLLNTPFNFFKSFFIGNSTNIKIQHDK